MRMVARETIGTISLRIFLPIGAGVLFAALCVASARQNHVTDIPGWSHPAGNTLWWGQEPTDIGTPGDILLLAFNLPALIALLPLAPLTYWIQSEIVLRTAWGLVSVGQWYLIGRYFDIRRGLLAQSDWNLKLPLKRMLFGAGMVTGAIALGTGGVSIAAGHSSPWAFVWGTSFVLWGLVLMILALRWRSSSVQGRDRIDSLRLS
jgi:hypothetical protein